MPSRRCSCPRRRAWATASQQASLANWLEVVGQVFDGKLSFRCIYSNRRFRQGTITAFMDQFQAELRLLIEHCLQVQAN